MPDISEQIYEQMQRRDKDRAADREECCWDNEDAPLLQECEILALPEDLPSYQVDDYVKHWMMQNGHKSEDPSYACLVLPVAEARATIHPALIAEDGVAVNDGELVIEFRPYASEPFTHQMAQDMQQMAQALEAQYQSLRVHFRPMRAEMPERFRLVWEQPTEVEYTETDAAGVEAQSSRLERVVTHGNWVYDTEDQAREMAVKLNTIDEDSNHRIESDRRGILA